jgi:hypothetical protein
VPRPEFIDAAPGLGTPVPDDQLPLPAVRSDNGRVVFFAAPRDVEALMHAHRPQGGALA